MQGESKVTKKQINIPIAVFIIVGALIVLGGILSVAHFGKKTLECTNQDCFNHQFSICQPASWIASQAASPGEQVKYKINGPVGSDKCGVTFTDNESSNIHITCNFDNKVNFHDAQTLADNSPKTYDCRKT